jgi:DNA-binding MarR family transcriptional regulator
MKTMIPKRRGSPPGVEVKEALDMAHYLPYRIHLLASKIATPPTMVLSSKLPIRTREWRIIACLGSFGPLTNTELGQVVGMEPATITRSLQYLQENGLVVTRSSRLDKRKQVSSLTPEGCVAHDEIAPRRKESAATIENALTKQERREFYRLLDKLDARIRESQDEFEDVWDESGDESE